jgi:hypothetical protein
MPLSFFAIVYSVMTRPGWCVVASGGRKLTLPAAAHYALFGIPVNLRIMNYKWLRYQNDRVFQFMLREQSVDALFRAIASLPSNCRRRANGAKLLTRDDKQKT